MKLSKTFLTLCSALTVFEFCSGLDNGLALTPPMGWMAWQRFRCTVDCQNFPDECISEKLFRNVADLMVSEGYRALGYEYVIMDDCWLATNRTEDGKLQPDPHRFPQGIRNLSDYIHSKGLKFGIYEDYGNKTCEGYPGVLGHMPEDAQTFAKWNVDYVKLDGCYANLQEMNSGYREFGKYLNKTGRPMIYSCSWPAYQELTGMKVDYRSLVEHCNLWRNFGDIQDSWQSMASIMDYYALKQDFWQRYTGPGHWNDPDMLLIGNYGLSYDQSKAQMAVWAILAAPLIISADLRNIRPEFKEILQNKEIIKIDQDRYGIQGRKIYTSNGIDVWTRPISPTLNGRFSYAVAFVSRRTGGPPYLLSTKPENLGLYNPNGYKFYDLYSKNTIESFEVKPGHAFRVRINPSGVAFFRANVQK